MSLRVLLVVVLAVLFFPIAVFLRSANAAPVPKKPQVYIVTVCAKPVAVFADNNGYIYFATVAQMEMDEKFTNKLMDLFQTAEVKRLETADAAGIACPKTIKA